VDTPQPVADRAAGTFRLLTYTDLVGKDIRGPDPENFAALLDRSSRCCVCRRPLRDHVSTLLGIGPDCAKQWNLPHSLEAANRILQRRKELLGEAQPPRMESRLNGARRGGGAAAATPSGYHARVPGAATGTSHRTAAA
jgi:hypothetical protein